MYILGSVQHIANTVGRDRNAVSICDRSRMMVVACSFVNLEVAVPFRHVRKLSEGVMSSHEWQGRSV